MTSLNPSPRRKSLRGGGEIPTKKVLPFASTCPFRICLSSFIPETRCVDDLSAELHVLVSSLRHHKTGVITSAPQHNPATALASKISAWSSANPGLLYPAAPRNPAPRNPAPWNRASWGSANPSAARPLISMTCAFSRFQGRTPPLRPPYDMNAE